MLLPPPFSLRGGYPSSWDRESYRESKRVALCGVTQIYCMMGPRRKYHVHTPRSWNPFSALIHLLAKIPVREQRDACSHASRLSARIFELVGRSLGASVCIESPIPSHCDAFQGRNLASQSRSRPEVRKKKL